MKKLIYLSVFLIAVFILGCSKQIVSPEINSSSNGAIVLKIDRQNAPANVVTVTAILTRSGYDPISSSMNIQSDTSASIQLTQIPVGEWLLVVEAKDGNNDVKFRGETNVTILEGILTQVTLTLNPTSTGLGSIEIIVNWENGNGGSNFPGNWIDNPNNPILSSSNTFYDYGGVSQPKVIYFNGKYRMYYVGTTNNGVKFVLYAESLDGNVWSKPFSNPVLSPGPPGTWDSWAVHPGAIFSDNDTLRMYYCAWSNTNGRWDIGLAVSVDGITWLKRANPVILGSNGWDYQIVSSSVVKVNGSYFMYYYGKGTGNFKVGLAVSNDGLTWSKFAGNPILSATSNWEGLGISSPSVIYENNKFYMVYSNILSSNNNSYGMAFSTDGINWNKSNINPFFISTNSSNNWASLDISYPNFVKINNEYRIYYSGLSSLNQYYKIGYMTKTNL